MVPPLEIFLYTKLKKIIHTTKKHVAFLCIFMIYIPHHLRNIQS